MASFNFRSPTELVLNRGTTEEQSLFFRSALKAMVKKEEDLHAFFNFAMSDYAKEKLVTNGLYLSPNSHVSHSHPICKTLENHLLFTVVKELIDNNFFVVSMKDNKIRMLRNRSGCKALTAINRFIEGKDVFRYGLNNFIEKSKYNIPPDYDPNKFKDSVTLKDLVPQALTAKCRKILLHDELHYWSLKDLDTFLCLVKPHTIVATHVFPKELIAGITESLNPWAYEFKVTGDKLFFFPDGKRSEMYEQPLSGGIFLVMKHFTTSDNCVYTIDVHYSLYSHSVITITRGELLGRNKRFFGDFDATTNSSLNNFGAKMESYLKIRCELLIKILLYIKTLKKPDVPSALAKLRQMQEGVSPFEIQFIDNLIDFLLKHGEEKEMIEKGFCRKLKDFVVKCVPGPFKRLFESYKSKKMTQFIADLKPFEIEFNTIDCGPKYQFSDFVNWVFGNDDWGVELDSIKNSIEMSMRKGLRREYAFGFCFVPESQIRVNASKKAFRRKIEMINFLRSMPHHKLVKLIQEFLLNGVTDKVALSLAFGSFLAECIINDGIHLVARELMLLESRFYDQKFGGFLELDSIGWSRKRNESWNGQRHKSWDDDRNDDEKYADEVNEISNLFHNAGFLEASIWILDEKRGYRDHAYKSSPNFRSSYNWSFNGWGDYFTEAREEKDGFEGENGAEGGKEYDENFFDGAEFATNFESTFKENFNVPTGEETEGCQSLPSFFDCSVNGTEDFSFENFTELSVTGDGNCFFHCVSNVTGLPIDKIQEVLVTDYHRRKLDDSELLKSITNEAYAFDKTICLFVCNFKSKMIIFSKEAREWCYYLPPDREFDNTIFLVNGSTHFNILIPKEGCVIRAIAESLDRDFMDVFRVLCTPEHNHLLSEMNLGKGLPIVMLEECFRIFGIKAFVTFSDELLCLNEKGIIDRDFILDNGHLEFSKKKRDVKHKNFAKKENPALNANIRRNIGPSFEIDFTPSLDRAKVLQKSFLDGFSGKILSQVFGGQKSWLGELDIDINSCIINGCIGTFGSGKSFQVKRMIEMHKETNFLIISPRKALAQIFKDELGIEKKWRKAKRNNVDVLTFEVALKQKMKKYDIIIFDELQLFPPGYLDLFVLYNGSKEGICVLGDPAQSSYDSEKDRFFFGEVENDLINLLSGAEYEYLIMSRRFKNSVFKGRLPCEFHEIDKYPKNSYVWVNNDYNFDENEYDAEAVLVPSFDEKIMMTRMTKGKVRVLTYGESTGLTFRKGMVLLTQASMSVDKRRMLVALSRFSDFIGFINMTGEAFEDFVVRDPSNPIFNFCTERANLEFLMDMLPGKPRFVKAFSGIGSDEVDREERMQGDPWLKTHIFTGQRVEVPMAEANEPEIPEVKVKTHNPIESLGAYKARISELIKPKEHREVRIGSLQTSQFRDEYFIKDKLKISNQCDLFEAIYPKHRGDDTATFLMAVRKRLSFASSPSENAAKLKAAIPYGKLMFDVFKEKIPLKEKVNLAMLEEAQNDFEMKKLEKPTAVIEAHSERSNRDWDIRNAFLFMKSQLCTKKEKRFCEAKAGQTLACFSHIVLCRFAKWIRYIEKKVIEVMPQNYYIHSGKNFDDLEKWVLANDFSGECTESDYEAFDASQDANILAFELEVMRYLHVPEEIICDYIYIKINLRAKVGLFNIMRFTGEAGTFLFNTMANMVFTFMRYDLNGKESIAFAGDDMCANKRLRVTNKFEHVLSRLKLKAKVDYKHEATFCGWVIGSFGIYKSPQLILERFMVSFEHDTLELCIDNYAIEVSYAYKLGDKLIQYMSEEEMQAHHLCVRIIVCMKHKIKSSIAELFN